MVGKMKRGKKSTQQREDLVSQVIGIDQVRPSKRQLKSSEDVEESPTHQVSCISKHKAELLALDKEEWPALGSEPTKETNSSFMEYQNPTKTSPTSASSLLDIENDKDDELCNAASLEPMSLTAEEKLLLESEESSPVPNNQKAPVSNSIRLRITEKQTDIESQMENQTVVEETLKPELAQYCSKVGKVLATHRNGSLPKFVQQIPKLHFWEDVLYATNPENWTAKAMSDMTKIFSSYNAAEGISQKFFSSILLPRCRDDINEHQKLNPHLYQALFKTLYRPACFNKGILFPLCSSGNCTLREAVIFSSVLAKRHLPVNHAGAAIIHLCNQEYSGAASIFLTKLLSKGLPLPLAVIDEVIAHFMRYNGRWASAHKKELPVLWFQSLLCFVQHYKEWITDEAKLELRDLLKGHYHHQITPEIQRELDNSMSRRNEQEPETAMDVDL